jgi:hypothetical protein
MSEALAIETTSPAGPGTPAWPLGKLLAFRVLSCYLALYLVDLFVLSIQFLIWNPSESFVPKTWLTGYLWAWLVPWVGSHVLHLHSPVAVVDVGADFPFEFILRGVELAIALVAGVAWTVLNRSQRNSAVLLAWLRFGVRVGLAGMMLMYGEAKLIPMQFGPLTLHRLVRPLGELSPMGMLWAFMAASKGYTILCGAVEVLAGLLLLFPEVSALGAVLAAGAMANVFVLNVFYDVNQKIRSLNYLLLALFLLAPYVRRLMNVLVWNRPTEPVTNTPLSSRRWIRIAARWLPLAYGLVFLALLVPEFHAYSVQQRAQSVHDANFGVWRATSFTVADPSRPLLTRKLLDQLRPDAEQYRWKRLIFDANQRALLQFSSGQWDFERYRTQANPAGGGTQTILTDPADPAWKCVLVLQHMPGGQLQMSGTINGNEVQAVFQREDGEGAYHLADRIHWFAEGNRDY